MSGDKDKQERLMPGDPIEHRILIMLGRIEGELSGLNTLVKATSEATNQRIDDLKESMNKKVENLGSETDRRFSDMHSHFETRIEELSEETDKRFANIDALSKKRSMASGGVSGGAGGAIVTGLAELVRAMLS